MDGPVQGCNEGIKIGFSGVEGLGTTLRAAYRFKLGVK